MLSLLFPISVTAIESIDMEPINENIIESISSEEAKAMDDNEPEAQLTEVPNTNITSPYKQPYSKKSMLKKLIIAMLCVIGSSVFLYISLSVYNKLKDTFIQQEPIPPEGEKALDTPSDISEAVKSFVERTNWNR